MPIAEARISPLDRGFLYGDGLFETMRSYGGKVHLLRRHLDRLRNGGERIGLRIPAADYLCDAIHAVLQANILPDGSDARIRLTVSRGSDPEGPPTIFIRQSPLLQNADKKIEKEETEPKEEGPEEEEKTKGKSVPEEEAQNGEELVVLPLRRTPPEIFPRLKSLNYLPEILAQDDLRRRGVREGILLTHEGYVAEGSVSNIFCVINGELLTPPIDLGILPGITRGRIIELAGEEGLTVTERSFSPAQLLAADECFYTNSLREVVPVRSVEGAPIGSGTPGPVTVRLRSRYRAEVADEEG